MDQTVNKSQLQPPLKKLIEYRHSSNKTCKAVKKHTQQPITKVN